MRLRAELLKELAEVYALLEYDNETTEMVNCLTAEYLMETYALSELQANQLIHDFPKIIEVVLHKLGKAARMVNNEEKKDVPSAG